MALLRPHPDDEKRPIFNFFHWGVGTSAHILASMTLNLITSQFYPNASTSICLHKLSHRNVLLGYYQSVINIFIGISLPKADASQKVTYFLWTYVAWQVFMGIILTVYDCCQKREEKNYETTEMIEMRDYSYKYSVSANKKKKFITLLKLHSASDDNAVTK
ncbi:hypothetical protein CHS0354_018321 [Potamilus streckersoni]|uniref:Uncharacterized protein n=1 Tax=Potamilus streckersoni TaxID=2493646 RepID=A0AAE0WGA5_9BIVA|nr:hypothetical protein CHS0354_018321 [Potamilus streckersoni]